MDATTWTRRAAMCVGKEAFSTPQLASKVQRRRAKTKHTYKVQQGVYHCEACGLFHIGTPFKPLHTAKVRRPRRAGHSEDDTSMDD